VNIGNLQEMLKEQEDLPIIKYIKLFIPIILINLLLLKMIKD